MNPRPKVSLFGAATCLALATSSVHAAQVYLEEFTHTGSGDLPLTDYGWSVRVTENGQISSYSPESRAIGVSNLDYAFFAPKQDDGAPWNDAVGNDPALASTTVPAPINIGDLTSIGWDSSADNTDHAFRVALQVDGVWYASATSLNDGIPDSGINMFTALVYNPASFETASNWVTIQNTTLGATGTLSLGAAPGSDLSGSVTDFGLFLVSGTNNETAGDHVRWDNFEINAVPEPSVMVLGCFGLLGLLARRRV